MAPQNPYPKGISLDPDKAYPQGTAIRRKLDRINDSLVILIVLVAAGLVILILLAGYIIFR